MKRILYIFAVLIFAINTIQAQGNSELSEMLNFGNMPTDEQIRQTIRSFNFDEQQQEFLFRETKKQLQQTYQNGNAAQLQQDISPEMLESFGKIFEQGGIQAVGTGLEGLVDAPAIEPEIQEVTEPEHKKKYAEHDPLFVKKKYASHDPIFVKRKYGPNRSKKN